MVNNVMQFRSGASEAVRLNREEIPDFQQQMLNTIEMMDEYAKNRGTLGGFDTGYPKLNEALEGLNTGLILIAGQSNVGKSALCMQLGWQVAKCNRVITKDKPHRAYVLYFSLDDNANDLLPRCISIEERIPINAVKFPAKFEGHVDWMTRRASGINKLKNSLDCFKMLDANDGDNIEFIEDEIRKHTFALKEIDESYKLVVFIDNFHDIAIKNRSFREDKEKYDYLAGELSRICTLYDIPIVCTAEFRKLNGNRRPTIDDVRESVKIAYEAKAIILCYNEVGLRGPSANVFWARGDEKMPVLEAKVGKNKFSSYKGRLFFEFWPEYSLLTESHEDDAKRYNQMITS